MSSVPEIARYLAKLREHGAKVVDNLVPGVTSAELAKFEDEVGLALPEQLKDFWREIGGIASPRTYHLDGLIGALYAPHCLAEAKDDCEVFASLREGSTRDEASFAEIFWPKGFVKFAGENTNGFYVNCRTGSPTYGAVYLRGLNSDPLKRWANDLRSVFETLIEGLTTGALYIAGASEVGWDNGALAWNYEKFAFIAGKMNPDCPAHDDASFETISADW